jgi:hypothetical protein
MPKTYGDAFEELAEEKDRRRSDLLSEEGHIRDQLKRMKSKEAVQVKEAFKRLREIRGEIDDIDRWEGEGGG